MKLQKLVNKRKKERNPSPNKTQQVRMKIESDNVLKEVTNICINSGPETITHTETYTSHLVPPPPLILNPPLPPIENMDKVK